MIKNYTSIDKCQDYEEVPREMMFEINEKKMSRY